ncbi:hypothetical protein [Phaffia rhodozyma]|uniref:Uncharacterized protein n=1 Tax=Phaffia rhodozyma TaxID=264483 RepID=A0A0F7STL0_PHARH|nr:hypothetical protein [Phaffia rhodozyma]
MWFSWLSQAVIEWIPVVLSLILIYAPQLSTFVSFLVSSKKRTSGFYWILGSLVGPVWLIPWVCWVWSGWAILWRLDMIGGKGFPGDWGWARWGRVWTGWCFLESVFILYHAVQAFRIQASRPPHDLPANQIELLFLRILQAGMDPLLEMEDGPDTELIHSENELSEALVDVGETTRRGESLESVKSPRALRLVRRLDTADPRAKAFAERLRTWFFRMPWESIKKDNIMEWVAWSAFNSSVDQVAMDPTQKASLEYAVDLISRRTGTIFEEGRTNNVEVMRLTLDRVNIYHRPLVLYALTAVINLGCEAWCRAYGMRRNTIKGIDYMVRIPHDWTPEQGREDKNREPIVFLHGLGFGFLQNQIVIGRLVKRYPSHPIMIVVQPHISMNLFNVNHLRPISKDQFVDSLSSAIEHYRFYDLQAEVSPSTGTKTDEVETVDRGGVVMFSHSKGTVGHSWLMKDRPELIKRSCFADPVVFCLWEGDVCFNFVYREPGNAIELLMSYFIGSELGIANTISRNFNWSHNTLFFEDIPHAHDPSRTAFFLGGKDSILDAQLVKDYLERHGATQCVHFTPSDSHGSAIISGSTLTKILKWLSGDDK